MEISTNKISLDFLSPRYCLVYGEYEDSYWWVLNLSIIFCLAEAKIWKQKYNHFLLYNITFFPLDCMDPHHRCRASQSMVESTSPNFDSFPCDTYWDVLARCPSKGGLVAHWLVGWGRYLAAASRTTSAEDGFLPKVAPFLLMLPIKWFDLWEFIYF